MTDAFVLRVNGVDREVSGAWLGESLLYVLRERLGLPGSKTGCEQGECGSCSVFVDGALVCACLVLAAAAVGTEILTVEVFSPTTGGSSPTCSARSCAKAPSSAASARPGS